MGRPHTVQAFMTLRLYDIYDIEFVKYLWADLSKYSLFQIKIKSNLILIWNNEYLQGWIESYHKKVGNKLR